MWVFFLSLLYWRFANCVKPNPNIPDKLPLDQFYSFKTRPDILAPRWEIQKHDEERLSPGFWFTAIYEQLSSRPSKKNYVGPGIYDDNGQLIWSPAGMFNHSDIFDFRVTQFEGKPVISLVSLHTGSAFILNDRFEVIREFYMGKFGSTMNMHEFNLVDDGTRALTIHRNLTHTSPEQAMMIGHKGKCSVAAHYIRESDTTANFSTLFEWHILDHVPLNESTNTHKADDIPCEHNWDFLHANALDKCSDGDLLLSVRHTDTVYKISHDGSIVWRLGGKISDFQQSFKFSRQHHAKCRETNATHTVISLMDNAMGDDNLTFATNDYSRGLLISLDTQTMKADAVAEYPHPEKVIQNARGSCEILPDGNVFMGWSNRSLVSEHSADGTLLMSAKTVPNWVRTYRSYKFPFVGRPRKQPDVFSQMIFQGNTTSGNGHDPSSKPRALSPLTEVYVSWNGATEVAHWNLYLSNSTGEVRRLLTTAERHSFETRLTYSGLASHVIVEATDKNQNPIENGVSDVITTRLPNSTDSSRPAASQSAVIKQAKVDEQEQLREEEAYQNGTWRSRIHSIKEYATAPLALVMLAVGLILGLLISLAVWKGSSCSGKRPTVVFGVPVDDVLAASYWRRPRWFRGHAESARRRSESLSLDGDEATDALLMK